MNSLVLQCKIDDLLNSISKLAFSGNSVETIYLDEFTALNHSIYKQINELYPLQGYTVEQDANLCLAMLLGFSIYMYANPEDELKRRETLIRSQLLLKRLSSSSLRERLASICDELSESIHEP